MWEETGLRCELGDELEPRPLPDNKGRPKIVRYWSWTPVEDEGLEPNDEVDEVRWVAPADAERLLTYDHDRALVAGL